MKSSWAISHVNGLATNISETVVSVSIIWHSSHQPLMMQTETVSETLDTTPYWHGWSPKIHHSISYVTCSFYSVLLHKCDTETLQTGSVISSFLHNQQWKLIWLGRSFILTVDRLAILFQQTSLQSLLGWHKEYPFICFLLCTHLQFFDQEANSSFHMLGPHLQVHNPMQCYHTGTNNAKH